MQTFKITMATDDPVYNGEHTTNWSAFDKQQAVAQAMLYYAQNGSRKLEVKEIIEVQTANKRLAEFIDKTLEDYDLIETDKECLNNINSVIQEGVTFGRLSVLQDFDDMCKADAFVGFPDAEWQAIKKFFAFNKSISNWYK